MDSTGPVGAVAMKPPSFRVARRSWQWALSCALSLAMLLTSAVQGHAQSDRYERTYRQSKSAVEKALKELQPAMSGRLPVLEGFAMAGEHPLNRYQRAYYQSAVQVTPSASGGSVVR